MDEPPRLPTALEASALIRATQALGGDAMVLHKGDADGGTILVVLRDRAGLTGLYERLPRPDGPRRWEMVRRQEDDSPQGFEDALARRLAQDRDVWIIELTIADGERLILNAR